jgi:hypothetical protein
MVRERMVQDLIRKKILLLTVLNFRMMLRKYLLLINRTGIVGLNET